MRQQQAQKQQIKQIANKTKCIENIYIAEQLHYPTSIARTQAHWALRANQKNEKI